LQKLRALHQQNLIDSNYSKIIQAARKALERNTKFAYISNANIEDATMLTIFANQRSTKIFL
jgi:acetylglutamate kinase